MTSLILVERDGDIATVTFNNPKKMNVLNIAMWRDLSATMASLSKQKNLRYVVLRGARHDH